MGKLSRSLTNEFIVDLWLFVLRVAVGASMLTHGIPKLQMLFAGGEIQFPDPFGIGAIWTLILVVFAEALCSVLLIFGIFTRLASIPLIINMTVAFFVIHGPDPFGKKELAFLYLIIYLMIVVFGGGKLSLDSVIRKR